MKLDVKKLVEDLGKEECFVDKTGNIITIIGFNEKDAAKFKKITKEENCDWCIARISREGDVEVIQFFKTAEAAEDAMPYFCAKNDWIPLVESNYAFTW